MTSEDIPISGQQSTTAKTPIGEDSQVIDWEKARQGARLLLEAFGRDPDTDELEDTWQRRVPKAIETLSEGERPTEKPTMRTFEVNRSELVIKTGIPFYSLCEHHLLPYYGTAHVAYRPDEQVVGLSKIVRYVRWQSRRLTMQERLTNDIADGLADELAAEAVLVELTGTHLCEAMRGVETASETKTRATAGTPTETEHQQLRTAIERTETSP
jgi:GTP cyclohydrolase I